MNQKLGTPESRHAVRSSPSEFKFHTGFTRDAISSPKIFAKLTTGLANPVANMMTSASSVLPSSNSRPVGVYRLMTLSFFSLILPSMISCDAPTSR